MLSDTDILELLKWKKVLFQRMKNPSKEAFSMIAYYHERIVEKEKNVDNSPNPRYKLIAN